MDKDGFTAYLESKGFAVKTIAKHVNYVEQFLAKTKKEDIQVTKPDVLKFLEYLKNHRKVQNEYRSYYLNALNYYFTFLYQAGQIDQNPCLLLKIRGTNKKRLYKIYTSEELEQLFDNYYQLFVRNYDDNRIPKHQQQYTALSRERNALIVSILIYQGLTTGEVERIEINDLDLIKATLKIQGGKRANERILPLKATQIGLLMHYLQNIRPKLLEYQTTESNKLFLLLPNISQKKTANDDLRNVFTVMIPGQIKSIDKQFINFKQVRASVITCWIKTQGLRKAQYLAGHRYISATEKYLPNNLDDLIEDINKLHPFL